MSTFKLCSSSSATCQWLIDDQSHFVYVSKKGKYQGLISSALCILEFFEEFRTIHTFAYLQDGARYWRFSTSWNKYKVKRPNYSV